MDRLMNTYTSFVETVLFSSSQDSLEEQQLAVGHQ